MEKGARIDDAEDAGLVGSALAARLRTEGHTRVPAVQHAALGPTRQQDEERRQELLN